MTVRERDIRRILRNGAREERGGGKEVGVGYKTIGMPDEQFGWDEERQRIVETETWGGHFETGESGEADISKRKHNKSKNSKGGERKTTIATEKQI